MTTSVFNYNALLNKQYTPFLHFLARADSIHDFDDEGGRVLPVSWNSIDTLLKRNLENRSIIQGLDNGQPYYYSRWLTANSYGGVTSASEVEAQTVEYFENDPTTSFLLNTSATKKLTYRGILNIITQSPGNDINEKIYNACQTLFQGNDYTSTCILDVDMEPGEDWDMSYSPEDKIYIGLFFLNFFFPPPQDNIVQNTQLPSYMTFDAGSNIPSKIFGLLDQVINLVTPLNIADSALGETHLVVNKSQKRAGVKNRYEFPINGNNVNGNNAYLYSSNVYTPNSQLYITSPQDEPYTESNKYNFTISVTNPQNEPLQIQFDQEHTSGPSVRYLSNLIAWDMNPQTTPYAERKMADLTTFVQNLDQDKTLLLDLKRSGDWEQCNAAYVINKMMESHLHERVILCTIDRLCGLYSRCIGQNTIWHFGTHLKLYRFPGGLTDEQIEEILKQQRIKKEQADANALIVMNNIKEVLSIKIRTLIPIIQNGIPRGMKPDKYPIDALFTKITRLLLLQTYNEMIQLINIPENDANLFFKELSSLFGQSINPQNYLPFIDLLNKPMTDKKNASIIEKSVFGYYDYTLIIFMKDIFYSVLTFNPDKQPRSISVKNYYEDLLSKGVFSFLANLETIFREKIGIQTYPVFNEMNIFNELQKIPYEITNPFDYTETNVNYYNVFKDWLLLLLSLPFPQMEILQGEEEQIPRFQLIGGVGNKTVFKKTLNPEKAQAKRITGYMESKKATKKSEIENRRLLNYTIENIINNTSNALTDEFVILCASLTEIAESKLNNIPQLGFLSGFIPLFKNQYTYTNQETNEIVEPKIDLSDDEKFQIIKSIVDFLENTYIAIQKMNTELSEFTNEITANNAYSLHTIITNYLSIYFFLACLDYLNFISIQPPENVPANIIDVIGNLRRDDNTWRQEQVKELSYYEFVNEICNHFYPEYLPANFRIYISTQVDNYYFILKFCIRLIDQNIPIENIVLMIFVFFQNYIKYVIGSKTISVAPSQSLDDFGYYPGILSEFHSNASASKLFQSLLFVNDGLNRNTINSLSWEFQQNTIIVNHFSIITYHLLHYIETNGSMTLLKQMKSLTGGNNIHLQSDIDITPGNRSSSTIQRKFTIHRKQNTMKRLLRHFSFNNGLDSFLCASSIRRGVKQRKTHKKHIANKTKKNTIPKIPLNIMK